MEYLVAMTTHVPDGTPDRAVDDVRAREAARSRELAAAGHLLRLWRPPLRPGEWRSLGLFAAADGGQLEEVLASMPLRVWRTDEAHAAQPAPERPGDGHPMSRNDRRVAIITGGSQGIGAGPVAGYRERGWAVVANALTIKQSEDPDVLTVEGDIAKRATTDRIIEGALERFGRIDTLVNNAGVFVSKPFTDYTAEDYALVVGVNLAGFFWLTQRVIAEMVRRYGGHVVNISATLAEVASSSAPSVLAALTKGGAGCGDPVAGRRVRLARHPGQRRLAGHHPDAGAPPGKLPRPRRPAPPARAGRPGQRRRRRHPVPGVIPLHHRRDPAHRRRPDRGPLGREGLIPCSKQAGFPRRSAGPTAQLTRLRPV